MHFLEKRLCDRGMITGGFCISFIIIAEKNYTYQYHCLEEYFKLQNGRFTILFIVKFQICTLAQTQENKLTERSPPTME